LLGAKRRGNLGRNVRVQLARDCRVALLPTRSRGFAPVVMAELGPAIHVFLCAVFFVRASQDVDGRPSPAMTMGDKAGVHSGRVGRKAGGNSQ
jgi:hypothetical protein